uniref:Uncharacterized protein n=1 Tax=Glossina pallidipes TaxID=7398 RepID=A0A1B0A9P8_GLOPL
MHLLSFREKLYEMIAFTYPALVIEDSPAALFYGLFMSVEGLLVSLGLDIDNVATTVMYSRIDLNGDWQKKKKNKKTSKIVELKSSTLENHLYEPTKYFTLNMYMDVNAFVPYFK